MHVRVARPEEYEQIGDIIVTAYRTLPVDHLWGGYDDEIRRVDDRAKAAVVLVAVEADEVLGTVTLVDDPDSAWHEWAHRDEAQVRLLAVDPAAQGRGAAEALMRECMRRAAAAGKGIVLHTTPHMDVARRLYPALGFVRTPERDVHDYDEMSFLAYEWPGRPERSG